MAHRIPLVAAVAIACASVLTGCSALASLQNQPVRAVYARWSDAPHTTDPQITPPAFVPHDATRIYVQTLPNGHGAILTYRSRHAPDRALCTTGALSGRPRLDYNWWPDSKPPAKGTRCSPGWQVFREGDATYAWKN
jgi:hypothetical protein